MEESSDHKSWSLWSQTGHCNTLKGSDPTVAEGQGRTALQILLGDPPQEDFLMECGIIFLVTSHSLFSILTSKQKETECVWIRLLSLM